MPPWWLRVLEGGISLTSMSNVCTTRGMFEGLAGEVERLSIPPEGAAIAAAVAVRDQLEAKIAEAVGAFDAASLWGLDAATRRRRGCATTPA